MLQVDSWLSAHRHQRVYFDANVFIYVLTRHERHGLTCLRLLQACAEQAVVGMTGHATLAGLLVKPLRLNDALGVADVRQLVSEDSGVQLLDHSGICFEQAAQLRARHNLKMIDALHLATAIHAGASSFVSNDFQFPPVPGLECVRLD
jgi:predicted nucleic acid-binding protein